MPSRLISSVPTNEHIELDTPVDEISSREVLYSFREKIFRKVVTSWTMKSMNWSGTVSSKPVHVGSINHQYRREYYLY